MALKFIQYNPHLATLVYFKFLLPTSHKYIHHTYLRLKKLAACIFKRFLGLLQQTNVTQVSHDLCHATGANVGLVELLSRPCEGVPCGY